MPRPTVGRLGFALGLLALFAAAPAPGADGPVRLKKTDATVEVTIGGDLFATYHFRGGYAKPFLADLRAPGGTVITRSLAKEAVTDHPHHKGLWFSIDEVDGNQHWAEKQEIRAESVEVVKAEGDPAVFRVVSHWLDGDGGKVLKETTTIGVSSDRVVSYDVTLTPAGPKPVEFEDTKEGLFAVRVRDELRAKGGTGQIVNAQGDEGEANAWGKPAPWVDYSGTVDGKAVGVAIFDHPGNFRPSRYHVRGYGLFAVSPFGEKAYTNGKNEAAHVVLEPGQTLRLRYAAFIHEGDAESADVAGRFRRYAEAGH